MIGTLSDKFTNILGLKVTDVFTSNLNKGNCGGITIRFDNGYLLEIDSPWVDGHEIPFQFKYRPENAVTP